MKKSISPFSFIMFILGLLCALMLGVSLFSMATLHVDMWASDSPFVGAAPFFNVGFIFVFAWLTFAFFGVTENERRRCRQLPAVKWGWPTWWFAVGLSVVAALYFIYMYSTTERNPEVVGLWLLGV
ncbi:MAG: hypothetical protein IKV92_07450 [Akkermansia sp.]|jgi:hypothetical protein|nr:hypothetical protein [Akkermansia sp.]MBR5876784.1 hypothetical protein [Akkermansia sp.]